MTELTASITGALGGWTWFAWLGQALAQVISVILWVLLFPASLALGFRVGLIGQAVASPFLDTLSQKVEINEISTPETPLTAGSVAPALQLLSRTFLGRPRVGDYAYPSLHNRLDPGARDHSSWSGEFLCHELAPGP